MIVKFKANCVNITHIFDWDIHKQSYELFTILMDTKDLLFVSYNGAFDVIWIEYIIHKFIGWN